MKHAAISPRQLNACKTIQPSLRFSSTAPAPVASNGPRKFTLDTVRLWWRDVPPGSIYWSGAAITWAGITLFGFYTGVTKDDGESALEHVLMGIGVGAWFAIAWPAVVLAVSVQVCSDVYQGRRVLSSVLDKR